ncbi:MAG: hypothetical protein V2I26_02830 [Halieaceae bacterium]|nr:hypothetical protein [Halieaceae bacterium]
MTILIASSVVRGSQQGESHGGVYLVDTQRNTFEQVLDWNTQDIDWQGRGWDRGLRGIAFDGEQVFMAASNELFVYSPDFRLLASYRNPFLMHAHEIAVHERQLYLTSTGFDSVLGFDLDRRRFCFGMHVQRVGGAFQARLFDPMGDRGPAASNDLHINNVFCNADGIYISGLKTASLLRYHGGRLKRWGSLPRGVHNARPLGAGVVYNHTDANQVCWQLPERRLSLPVPQFEPDSLTHTGVDELRIARPGFGRGLCVLSDSLIATGCSPSTVVVYDLEQQEMLGATTLTRDVRNAIHGLEPWPF